MSKTLSDEDGDAIWNDPVEEADTPDLEEQKLDDNELARAILDCLYPEKDIHLDPQEYADLHEGLFGSMLAVDELDILHPGLLALLHQHHNALLRELEGRLPHKEDPLNSKSMPFDGAIGYNTAITQVKQILADARVGGENV